jgi:hypothetical protein
MIAGRRQAAGAKRTRRRVKRAIGLLVSDGAGTTEGHTPIRPSGSRRIGHRHL